MNASPTFAQILMNKEAAQAKRGGGREWICILAFRFAGATTATVTANNNNKYNNDDDDDES